VPNVSNRDDSEYEVCSPDINDTDTEDDDDDSEHEGYAAERTRDHQLVRTTRKEVMDGVYVPRKAFGRRNEVALPERERERAETKRPPPNERGGTEARKYEPLVTNRGQRPGADNDAPRNPIPQNDRPTTPPTKGLEEGPDRRDPKWGRWRDGGADERSATKNIDDQKDRTYRPKAPTPPANAPLGARTTRAPDARAPDVEMKDDTRGEDGGGKKGSKEEYVPNRKYKFEARQEPESREPSRNQISSRRTELSLQITPRDVLKKILSTQISLTAGEILGTSRELSIALADQIRVKNVASVSASTNHTCANHSSLLRVPVKVGNYTYNAIIDSGSEVNLIKRRVWENDLKVPMDVSASMTLHDANGGTSTLKGIIPDLELKIGGLITTSNYWVTTTCPLDILLGRPWQRQNLVSIDERTDGTYLRFNRVNGDRVMEILVMPHEDSARKGNHATASRNSLLGIAVVEPTLPPSSHHESQLQISSHTPMNVGNFIPLVEFKRRGIGHEYTKIAMPEPSDMLKRAYFQVFQPEPNLIDYGTAPIGLDNSRLGPIASPVHQAIGNHMSPYLLLNSAQSHTLPPSIKNVFRNFKTTYVVHATLPEINSDRATWEVTLPTVRLPDDARKITSPLPYTLYHRLGIPGDPYLPLYQVHVERYNRAHLQLPLPSLTTRFANGVDTSSNLSLLADVCTLRRHLARIQEERSAAERDEDRTRKVPPPSPLSSPPLTLPPPYKSATPSFSFLAPDGLGGRLVDKTTYVPTPSPSLISSSTTLIPEDDLTDTDADAEDADDECSSLSSYSSERSSYPPPFSNPTTYADTIGRKDDYNLAYNTVFNPIEARKTSTERFTAIPFMDGVFDGTGHNVLTEPPPTTGFIPATESNSDYTPPPFSGVFPPQYLEPANFYATCLYNNHRRYLEDSTGQSSTTELLTRFPAPVYFGRTSAYELHVYRGSTNYRLTLPVLRQLRGDALTLIHAIHALLTPHQAAECLEEDIQVLFVDGNTCAEVHLNRGHFFQQRAPSANPLFSIEETGFMRTACGYLRYYGETELARVIDLILQLPLPDEDLVASLLAWHQLDAEFAPSRTKYDDDNTSTYRLARHLKTKQDAFYHKYGSAEILPPPCVPRSLLQLTN
jgi:hypothetical protein